jgi:NADPH:quinone reductase-like Zn-dependent oxidoreductase
MSFSPALQNSAPLVPRSLRQQRQSVSARAGHDFAGVVEAVGSGVERLKVGDEVFGLTTIRQACSFAEYVVADEKNVGLKPSSISFERAAALTLVSVTAW